MKIVVLGSGGMLGTALMQRFSEHEVFGLDRSAVDASRRLDITNRDEVFSVLSGISPDVVLNAAAYTAVDDAEKNSEIAMQVNRDGTTFVADFCRSTGARLVHFSTDYVFDGRNLAGYSEKDVPGNPLNVYGSSKLAGEQALVNFENFSMKGDFYLVRTSWLYGPHGKNFVQTMMYLAEIQKELSVVNDQIGNPTHTVDLADAVFRLLGFGDGAKDGASHPYPFGIYHLVNERSVSWYEFAQEIFMAVGISPLVKSVSSDAFPRPAARPSCSILRNTKFPLLRDHREALQDFLKAET